MLPFLLIFTCWLIGSIPFSYLIARRTKNVDLREVGSGNVGATNVLRSAGKLPGLIALLLDMLKGFSSVWLVAFFMSRPGWPFGPEAGALGNADVWTGAAALAAVVGHLFPPWLRFRGGKGVATGAGAFLAIEPLALGFALIVFLLAVAITRFVAVGSMLGAATFPIFLGLLFGGGSKEVMFASAIALLVVARHHTNIRRIIAGTEARFPFREDE